MGLRNDQGTLLHSQHGLLQQASRPKRMLSHMQTCATCKPSGMAGLLRQPTLLNKARVHPRLACCINLHAQLNRCTNLSWIIIVGTNQSACTTCCAEVQWRLTCLKPNPNLRVLCTCRALHTNFFAMPAASSDFMHGASHWSSHHSLYLRRCICALVMLPE